jgi:hypothetical protein
MLDIDQIYSIPQECHHTYKDGYLTRKQASEEAGIFKRKKLQTAKYSHLEDTAYCMKTENIALKMRTMFRSSNGFLQRFQYRHNIVSMKIPCEHSPGDAGIADKCYKIWHQYLNRLCYIKNHCAQKNTVYSAQLNIMTEWCTRAGWCVGQVDYQHESKFINNITVDNLKIYKNNCLEKNGHPLH